VSVTAGRRVEQVRIPSGSIELQGALVIPRGAQSAVLFAHGSGSSRLSPRNAYVALALQRRRIATLLFDLLTEAEAEDRRNVFDVDLLSRRLTDATRWLRAKEGATKYVIGYFGASTGAAAALTAAARDPSISAVVSRGGRPDLAMSSLGQVDAPTLVIVGGEDTPVIAMNRAAYEQLGCEKKLAIVAGATHLFEEPGTLDEVVRLGCEWFERHLKARPEIDDPPPEASLTFADRSEAGRKLAALLMAYKDQKPVILGIPRGGVPVAFEIARALDAPLDVVVVRKLGAPGEPELGIGALVDGERPETVLNHEAITNLGVSRGYLDREIQRQLKEIERRQNVYRRGRPRVELKDRTAIVVDDGIATGGSMRAALRGIRRAGPKRVVLAVPVAPAETIEDLARETDEVVCVSTPEGFYAIGQFYLDFRQLTDEEVIRLLESARR
jgi:putative phosphoribosyl transferase